MLEGHRIGTSGIGFLDFWDQGQKLIKSGPLGFIFWIFWAKASKSSNRNFGNGFVDFWGQGQEAIKSGFLVLIVSTSGAKAGDDPK